MSEMPFARMLGLAAILKGTKSGRGYWYVLVLLVITLSSGAWCEKITAQGILRFDGAIRTITFETEEAFDAANEADDGWDGTYTTFTDADKKAITNVVTYLNDIIEVPLPGFAGSSVELRRRPQAHMPGAVAHAGPTYGMCVLEAVSANPAIGSSTQTMLNGFEELIMHEMGHVLYISGMDPGYGYNIDENGLPILDANGAITFTSLNDSALGKNMRDSEGNPIVVGKPYVLSQDTPFKYFGPASRVYGDYWYSGRAEGIATDSNPTSIGLFAHPWDPPAGVMSYRSSRPFYSEVELAILQDLGHIIDRSRFFGRSLYQIHSGTIENRTGFNGDGMYGVGLHLVFSDDQTDSTAAGNTVIQRADLIATGKWGAGIRVEGYNHDITIDNGVTVAGNGEEGIGVVVTDMGGGYYDTGNVWHNYLSGGTVLTNNGTIEAKGTGGTGVFINADTTQFNSAGIIDARRTNDNGLNNAIYIAVGASGFNIDFKTGTNILGNIDADENVTNGFQVTGRANITGSIDIGANTLTVRNGGSLSAHNDVEKTFGELNIVSGNVVMDDGSMFRTALGTDGTSADLIHLDTAAHATLNGTVSVDLMTLAEGTYTLLTWDDPASWGGVIPGFTSNNFKYNGGAIAVGNGLSARKGDTFDIGVAVGANDLKITTDITGYANTTDNFRLTWTGAIDNKWEGGVDTAENWLDGGSATWFLDGDAVTFDLPGGDTVDIDAGQQRIVSDMNVTGAGNWTFNGNILGDNRRVTGALQTQTNGRLTMDGTGRLTLNGNNEFVGGTRVNAGTLIIGNGATDSSIKGDIVNHSRVAFSGTSVFNDNMSGTGSLTKSGGGISTMSGENTYTGATVINNGMLQVGGLDGTSSIDIYDGGTLSGLGNAAEITVTTNVNNNGGRIENIRFLTASNVYNREGIIAPGSLDKVGVLTIDGNLNSASGTFLITVDGSTNSRIDVENGNAVIEGGTVEIDMVYETDYLLNHDYVFLNADGNLRVYEDLTAQFIDDDPLLDTLLKYNDYSYSFSLQRTYSFSGSGKTLNQRAMGRYLDEMYPRGDLRNVILALQNTWAGEVERREARGIFTAPEADPLCRAFDQLIGGVYGTETSSSFRNTVMLHTTLANVVRRDYNHVSAAADAYHNGGMMRVPSDNLWGMVYGHAGSSQFDGNAVGYHQGFSGIMLGFDRKNDQRLRLGVFLSMGEGSLSSDLEDRGLSKELMLGHYLRKDTDNTYMLFQAGLGTHQYDTRRHIAFGSSTHSINRTAVNEHSAFLITGHFETGLKYRGGIFNLSPYVGLEYTGLLREGFTEGGANSLNLTVDREDYHVVRPMFGVRFDSAPFRFRSGLASFYGNVAWMYEFDAKERPSTLTARFTDTGVLGGTSFTVNGNDPGRDWVQAGFGLNYDINANLRGFVGYDAYANSQQVLHSANLGLVMQR